MFLHSVLQQCLHLFFEMVHLDARLAGLQIALKLVYILLGCSTIENHLHKLQTVTLVLTRVFHTLRDLRWRFWQRRLHWKNVIYSKISDIVAISLTNVCIVKVRFTRQYFRCNPLMPHNRAVSLSIGFVLCATATGQYQWECPKS
jgi:hypothetical protein